MLMLWRRIMDELSGLKVNQLKNMLAYVCGVAPVDWRVCAGRGWLTTAGHGTRLAGTTTK